MSVLVPARDDQSTLNTQYHDVLADASGYEKYRRYSADGSALGFDHSFPLIQSRPCC